MPYYTLPRTKSVGYGGCSVGMEISWRIPQVFELWGLKSSLHGSRQYVIRVTFVTSYTSLL